MKKHLVWLTLVLVAVFSSAALSANAQSNYSVRADVPFDFTVGNKTLPAGKIIAHGQTSLASPLSVTNLDMGQVTLRIARKVSGSDNSERAELVFTRYGDRYFLAQVWIQGYGGWEVIKSSSEKALERETRVASDAKPELVTVLATIQ